MGAEWDVSYGRKVVRPGRPGPCRSHPASPLADGPLPPHTTAAHAWEVAGGCQCRLGCVVWSWRARVLLSLPAPPHRISELFLQAAGYFRHASQPDNVVDATMKAARSGFAPAVPPATVPARPHAPRSALYPYAPGEAVCRMLDALEVIEEEERETVSKDIFSEVLNAVTELGKCVVLGSDCQQQPNSPPPPAPSYEAAISVAKRILAMWTKLGRQPNVNKMFLTIAILHLATGDVPAADAAFQEHIQCVRRLACVHSPGAPSHPNPHSSNLLTLPTLATRNDDYLAARECAAEEELVAACRNFDESALEEAKKAHVIQFLDFAVRWKLGGGHRWRTVPLNPPTPTPTPASPRPQVRRVAGRLMIGEAVPPLSEDSSYRSAVAALPAKTVGTGAAAKPRLAPPAGAGSAVAPSRATAASSAAPAPALASAGATGSLTSKRAALFAPSGGAAAASPVPALPSPAAAPAPPVRTPPAPNGRSEGAPDSAGADADGDEKATTPATADASAVLSQDEIAARIAAAKALEAGCGGDGGGDDEEEEMGML